jgi:hypothetical protein
MPTLGIPKLVKRYKIKSRSHPEEYHHLELWSDGGILCDCMAYKIHRNCRHKEIVMKKVNGSI